MGKTTRRDLQGSNITMIKEPRIITQEEFDALPDASNLNKRKPRIITQAQFDSYADAFVPDSNDSSEQTEENYYKNQAKLGFVDSISFVGAAANNIYELFSPTGKLNPGNPNSISLDQVGNYFGQTINSKTKEAQRDLKFLANQAGIDYKVANPNLSPDSETERYIGSGIRFAADLPVSLLTGGTSKAKYLFKSGQLAEPSLSGAIKVAATSLPGAAAKQGGVGVAAEVGADIGGGIEYAITDEETGLGRGLGGIALALSAQKGFDVSPALNLGQTPAKNAIKNAYNKVSSWALNKPIDTSSANITTASFAAKRFVKNVVDYQKGMPDFKAINEDFNTMRPKTSQAPYPLMVHLADNPQLMTTVRSEYANNPKFARLYKTEIEAYAEEIATNQSVFFGTKYENIKPLIETANNEVIIANKERIASRQKIDAEIEQATDSLLPERTPTEIGKSVEELVQKRKTVAYKEMTPLYNDLRAVAARDKSVLPAEGVKKLRDYVVGNDVNDIFKVGTKIEGQVTGYLSPKKVTETVLDFKTGTKKTKTSLKYEPLSFANVDSLKRALNRTKRGKLPEDQERTINLMSGVLEEVGETVTGGYFKRLKKLDSLYYEKIGIPFNSQTIKEIDYKKYAEEIYPVIVKREQNLDEFLGAVGPSGYPVIKEALFADMHSKMTTNNFNPNTFTTYVKRHEHVIDRVPGLRKELDDISKDFHILSARKGLIDIQAKQKIKDLENNFIRHNVSALQGDANFTQAANTWLNNPAKRDKIVLDLKALEKSDPQGVSVAYEMLRTKVTENILAKNTSESIIDTLTNPDFKQPLSLLMGKNYQKNLKSFAKLRGLMSEAEAVIPSMIKDNTKSSTVFGVQTPDIINTIKERLGSLFYKVSKLSQKLVEANPGQGRAEVLDLIVNPNSLQKFADIAKQVEREGITGGAVNKYISEVFALKPFHLLGLKPGVLENTNQNEK